MKKIIFNLMTAGLGDAACLEPIIRYASNMDIPYDIYILTKYPRLFEHLDKKMADNYEDLGIDKAKGDFLELNSSPFFVDGEQKLSVHPLAFFAQPLFVSPVDFPSLFMLRRILPDEDKRIKINIKEDSVRKLEKIIPMPLRECIAVHVGCGSQSRLHSDEFYNELINELLNLDYKVILFGNTLPYSAKIKVEHPNLINIVDKLDVDLLIALLSQAQTLITNDSSPLHIASAFDNNIILLSTFKHPDRLMHIRDGMRYYKAKGFYDESMINEKNVDFTDPNLVLNGVDLKEGDPLPKPPLVKEILRAVKDLHIL